MCPPGQNTHLREHPFRRVKKHSRASCDFFRKTVDTHRIDS